MEIDEEKAIAMRPAGEAYEMRLLAGGRSLSGVISVSVEDLRHIGQYGYKLNRGNIQVSLEMGIYRIAWKNKEWAMIRAGHWWELTRVCDAIREGKTTPKKSWDDARLKIVEIEPKSTPSQPSKAVDI